MHKGENRDQSRWRPLDNLIVDSMQLQEYSITKVLVKTWCREPWTSGLQDCESSLLLSTEAGSGLADDSTLGSFAKLPGINGAACTVADSVFAAIPPQMTLTSVCDGLLCYQLPHSSAF